MGGNALKNCVTRRYEAKEYYKLEEEVCRILRKTFMRSFTPITSYHLKESFGDMDIIVRGDPYDMADMETRLKEVFQSKGIVKNGNVVSFEYKEFQIDLIFTPDDDVETSLYYFAYNDLGNLVGRLAHMMGMKLGHDGLSYNWRLDDTKHFKNVIVLKDWSEILPVLGLSWERYAEGFDTIEDIFKFVASSKFFNKDIYLLQNRNHTARVRDKKRKTYMEFLKWLETYEENVEQTMWKNWSKTNLNQDNSKSFWLSHLFLQIPHFETIYNEVQKEWVEAQEFKRRFNGHLVSEWTGLKDKELGSFMKRLRDYYGDARLKKDIVAMNPTLVERWVLYFFEKLEG